MDMFKNLEQRADELLTQSTERTNKTPVVGIEEVKAVLRDFHGYKLSDNPSRRKKQKFTYRVLSTMLDKCDTRDEFYDRANQINTLVSEYQLSSNLGFTLPTNINFSYSFSFRNGELEKAKKQAIEFERKFRETANKRLEECDYILDASSFYSN